MIDLGTVLAVIGCIIIGGGAVWFAFFTRSTGRDFHDGDPLL